ncbi:MAG: DUF4184 family protein [Pseudolysinimonas sp.]
MPFTPSHMALALPFVRTPLLPAAVAIGSMAPDVPYFVPLGIPRALTHSPVGVPTVDLAIALVLVILWYAALRSPVIDLAPQGVRQRMRRLGPLGWRGARRGWALSAVAVIAAALVGTITHLAWDSFTHDGWLVDLWPALSAPLGPLPLYKWLQHASTVLGLIALAAWGWHWLRRTPPHEDSPIAGKAARLAVWIAVTAVFVGAGLAVWVWGMSLGLPPLDAGLVFLGATVAGGCAGLLGFLICGAWWVLRTLER